MEHLNNDLDDGDELAKLFGGTAEPTRVPVTPPASYKPRDFTEPCGKCRGSGRFGNFGKCFACNGKGGKSYKTSHATRAKARVSREDKLDAKIEAFKTEQPAAYAWMLANTGKFEFATSLWNALRTYGSLTDGQLAAVVKCMARDAERTAARATERAEREANAPAITVAKIEEAFAAATAAGKVRLKLTLDAFTFKPARKHPGTLYVTEGGQYLGKIAGGKFVCTRECKPEQSERIIAAAADPEAAAVAFGKRTGSCSCCGRELTNAESIDRGIGPICAEKYGW